MKILCPTCNAENDTETATAGLIQCVNCDEWFAEKPPAPRPVSIEIKSDPQFELLHRREAIRDQAWNFNWVAISIFIIGVIIALISAYNAISGNGAGSGFIVAGFFIGLALWLYLIAQVIFIRANTEK
jgi:hypothetical protein